MSTGNNLNLSSEPQVLNYAVTNKIYAEELAPDNKNDLVLVELRRLFVSSFY